MGRRVLIAVRSSLLRTTITCPSYVTRKALLEQCFLDGRPAASPASKAEPISPLRVAPLLVRDAPITSAVRCCLPILAPTVGLIPRHLLPRRMAAKAPPVWVW